ncbi:MAG: heparinase II/III family protein [Lentisphaeria bacterium]|nr:heparinase II/III family protein [Lentisphaeria bacterium]
MKLPGLIYAVFVLAGLLLAAPFCMAADAPEKAAPDIAIPAQLPQGHPRIYATAADREALQRKIETCKWAGDMYAKLEREVKPYVERHRTDPDWIVSRMQMNWEDGRRHTIFHAKNNAVPLAGRSGNAAYPTVRVAAGRVGNGTEQKLEDLIPFGDGNLKLARDGKTVDVPFDETGLAFENENMTILNLAFRAAIVYYFTGDEAYAKFAADILWVFVRGTAQQEQLNPEDVAPNEKGEVSMHGFLSYETLGDSRRFTAVPLIYDFIYPYLDKVYFESEEFKNGRTGQGALWSPGHPQGKKWAFEQFAVMFQKMVENKITRGGGLLGNWNLNEQFCAIPYALAMDDDADMPDGKGRQYYLDWLLNSTTPGNGAYKDVIAANLQPDTGLWPEAPAGYGQSSVQMLVQYGWLYGRAGIRVLDEQPLLMKGACAFPQVAFPNGRSTAWGDGSYATMYTLQAELMIAYAREKGDSALEEMFTSMLNFAGGRDFGGDLWLPLFAFVPELRPVEAKPASPRVSYSPAHALLMGRLFSETGMPEDALAYSVYGFAEGSGHYHENGLAMELYGGGHILGCDFGAGPNYWDMQHRMFNRMAVGHNTVVVNGAEIGSKDYLPLRINLADPMPGEPKPGKSERIQFSDVSTVLNLKTLKAEMRRVNAIVRTSPKTGFYLDIFRAKMLEGGGKTFDYLYHDLGTGCKFEMDGGREISPFDPASGFGYSYLKNVHGMEGTGAIRGSFDVGKDGMKMNVFIPGNELRREFYTAESPANFRYFDSFFREKSVPTLMIRRTDAHTWDRPFVVVYEPVRADDGGPHVASVQILDGGTEKASRVRLEIGLDDGSLYVIESSAGTDPDGGDDYFAVGSRAYGGKLEYKVSGNPKKE